MSRPPSLTNLLQVLGSAGAVIGACAGFFMQTDELRKLGENIVFLATLGGVGGAFVAFAIYAGIAVGGVI
jgi:hypothetical protein